MLLEKWSLDVKKNKKLGTTNLKNTSDWSARHLKKKSHRTAIRTIGQSEEFLVIYE